LLEDILKRGRSVVRKKPFERKEAAKEKPLVANLKDAKRVGKSGNYAKNGRRVKEKEPPSLFKTGRGTSSKKRGTREGKALKEKGEHCIKRKFVQGGISRKKKSGVQETPGLSDFEEGVQVSSRRHQLGRKFEKKGA